MKKGLIEWNSLFLTFSFIKEGASKKVLQFLMPLNSIYTKSACFYKQKKFIINTAVSFKQ
jgi:hypothetical protein